MAAKTSNPLLSTLQQRFERHPERHKGLKWDTVEAALQRQADKQKALAWMEESGGEPDVIAYDKKSGAFIFCDCAEESPKGRRSLCYDAAALASRKEHKPKDSAQALAKKMGVELLDEEQYQALQQLGAFDTKTSSWLATPEAVRKLGGALFGDRRFGRVFTYHNGAESYYAARGFRVILKV